MKTHIRIFQTKRNLNDYIPISSKSAIKEISITLQKTHQWQKKKKKGLRKEWMSFEELESSDA